MRARILLNGSEIPNSICTVDSLNNKATLDTEEGIHTKLDPYTSYAEVHIYGDTESILEN